MEDMISRKAAIDELNKLDVSDGVGISSIACSVQESAISAIQHLPSAQPEPCEDAISRQVAIRIVDGIDTWQAGWRGDAIESMKALPSAQPEPSQCWGCNCEKMEQLEPCEDTISRQELSNNSPELDNNFGELISRQAAIDTLDKHLRTTDVPVSYPGIISALTEWLNEVPSAQPETHDKRTETHSCDLISRQAAIDDLKCKDPSQIWDTADVEVWVNALPSAQPQLPEWAQKVEEYRQSAPSFVRNQLVWALYQTWKEYDGRLVHQRGKENR